MNWFLLSLACAFSTATTAALSKLILRKNSVFFTGWIRFAFSMPILLVVLFIYRPSLDFMPGFWKTVAVLLPFELTAYLLYLKALKLSPLSLTFPFLGFTPVFTVLTSYIFLREEPSLAGIAGVTLVSIGAYLLNANVIKYGLLEPVKHIYKEKGSMMMVSVALIFSITSVLGKKAILLSSPLSFAAVYYSIFFILLTPLIYKKEKVPNKKVERKDIGLFLVLGVVFAAAILLHVNAVVLTKVSYMISVKRTSLLFSVLFGALIFKEKNISCKFLGSSIMICGILILALA